MNYMNPFTLTLNWKPKSLLVENSSTNPKLYRGHLWRFLLGSRSNESITWQNVEEIRDHWWRPEGTNRYKQCPRFSSHSRPSNMCRYIAWTCQLGLISCSSSTLPTWAANGPWTTGTLPSCPLYIAEMKYLDRYSMTLLRHRSMVNILLPIFNKY